MSRLKTRLVKLEVNEKTKAGQQVKLELSEEERLWLENTIQSINEGTHISTPWIIRPVPPGTEPTGTFLHNTLNRIAENEQNEPKKKTG